MKVILQKNIETVIFHENEKLVEGANAKLEKETKTEAKAL